MVLIELDLEGPVDLVGCGFWGQLLAPERDHLLDAKEPHGQMAHISDAVILTNLEQKDFVDCKSAFAPL